MKMYKPLNMINRNYFAFGTGLILLVITIFIISCSQKNSGRSADEKAIREHIDRIVNAYMSRDSATVRATHSKQWRGFLSNSTHVLRGIGDYMKEALGSGIFNSDNPWRIVRYNMLEYDIVFHGETGIVNYVAEFFWEGETEKGSYKLRSIDIYGKEGGHWNQIASNIGPLPSEK